MIFFGTALLSSHLLVAVADMVPNVDVKKNCGETASVTGEQIKRDIDGCITDEQAAHGVLVKQWAQYAATDKQRCVRASSGYLPSYVEMLTCLETAKDAKSLPDDKSLSDDQELGAGN